MATTKTINLIGKEIKLKDEFFEGVHHKKVYLLENRNRSDQKGIPVTLNEEDTLELKFEDDLIWYATPDDFHEILELVKESRSGEEVTLSADSHLPIGKDRGRPLLNRLVQFGIVEGSKIAAKKLAAKMEKTILQTIGLNILDKRGIMKPFKKSEKLIAGPILLFLHGTGSSTYGSFADIFADQKLYDKLFKEYNGNILAFEHETWSVSPLDNVLKLIQDLPDQAELHVISYSRGGLLGDLLCLMSQHASHILNDSKRGELIHLYEKAYGNKFDFQTIYAKLFSSYEAAVTKKDLKVSRYIRVACPASGTTLLSDRLDLFFNVIMNLTRRLATKSTLATLNPFITKAVNETFKAIKTIGAEILSQRENVQILPGLEAMRPESPFIKWLNGLDQDIAQTNLYVVTGNSQIKLGQWRALKTILSKLYYWDKNDFVVDTASMYGGSRFGSAVQYFVQNNVIDHFGYFQDSSVRDLITKVMGTTEESHADLKSFVKGDKSSYYRDRGIDLSKYQEGLDIDYISGQKPVIILIPGIMGTHLDYNNQHIWLNFKNIHKGKLNQLKIDNNVVSERINASAYLQFYAYFQKSYDVVTLGYDWRNSLEDAAQKLETQVSRALEKASTQQIVIVAHSMGGLVVKQFMLDHNKIYDQLAKRNEFRFVMLGTPWRGSFLVPYTLLGYGRNINVVSLIDTINNKQQVLNIFKEYQGFLQMLPQVNDQGEKQNFTDIGVWANLNEVKTKNVGKPTKKRLDKVEAYFNKLKSKDQEKIKLENVYYIAGQKDKTVNGIIDDYTSWFGKKKLKFSKTKAGDGSVTWAMGIPEDLDKKNLFYSKVEHGQLANDIRIFAALEDIFSKERTNKLSQNKPAFRSGDQDITEFGEESFITEPFNFESDILGLNEPEDDILTPEIEVSIVAGDLRHATYPVMIGHFWKDGILDAERAMDNYLNRELSKKLLTGSYPQWTRDHYIYIDPDKSEDSWHGAIVVGIGKSESFNGAQLVGTIRAGAIEYVREIQRVQKFKNDTTNSGGLGITSLLIGSGFGKLQVSESLKSVIKGIELANEFLVSQEEYDQTITKVEIIELYHNKAEEAMYELCSWVENEENIPIQIKEYKQVKGAKEEMPYKSKKSWWQPFIINSTRNEKTGQVDIEYTTEIRAARSKKRDVVATGQFLDDISSAFAVSNVWDRKLAKVLFEILIPNEFKTYVRNQNNLKLNLDKDTANYPWEMIHDTEASTEPLCINAGLIRQLQTTDEERGVRTAIGNKALVIGDPKLDGYITQLHGAKKEAEEVAYMLSVGDAFEVNKLINPEYKDVILEIFSDEYRILHLAGHGIVDEENGNVGMVIGDGHFLKANDVKQLSKVPELVFINCCHLGQIDGSDKRFYGDRNKLAASLSTQFIMSGAKAVIAAGWAINDDAARDFGRIFYQHMMDGQAFHYAIREARRTIFNHYPHSNTWGAFQCYGDPYYQFDLRGQQSSDVDSKMFYIAKEVTIALQEIRAWASNGDRTNKTKTFDVQQELESVAKTAYEQDLITVQHREQIALCYADLDLLSEAITEVEAIMKEEKAYFSVRLLEQYCNWKVKHTIKEYDKLVNDSPDKIKDSSNKRVESAKNIEFAIDLLGDLIERGPTGERYVIRASAYRRLSLVTDDPLETLESSSQDYYNAYLTKPTYYHLSNWILIELFLYRQDQREEADHIIEKKQYIARIEEVDLLIQANTDKEFWRYSAQVHCELIRIIHKKIVLNKIIDTQATLKKIARIYRTAWNRSGTQKDKQGELEHIRIIRAHTLDEELTAFLTELEKKIEEQILV